MRNGTSMLRQVLRSVGTLGLAAAVVCGAVEVAAAKPRSTSTVRSEGALTATTERPASGSFELVERIGGNGRERPALWIHASGLDASRGDDGRRVAHGAYLVPVAGDEVFLGRLRVDGKGRGRLGKRNAKKVLEALDGPLRRQAGATIEVRGPQGAVLSGTVPAFDLDDSGFFADRRQTYGRFVRISSTAPTASPGSFWLRTDELAPGGIRNRAVIRSNGLWPFATYTVYLFGPRTVNLGNMVNEPNKGATLSLDSRKATIPGSIVRWSEFDGGRIEIRRGSTIYFRGDIAIFRSASERVADTGWARSRATIELLPTAAAGNARGLLTAAVLTTPRKRRQEVRFRAFDLDPGGAPYAVETVEPDGARHRLGSFETRGPGAAGRFRLSTRRGDRTPPGGVLGQAGRDVEVTDRNGVVIFTGTFPTLD